MKRETPMPQLVAPDEWNSNNGAITQVIKWLNTFQTSSTHFSREELQSIVDQAAEKYGIRAPEEFYFIVDGDGDMWSWDPTHERWSFQGSHVYGFEDGIEQIQEIDGIEDK